MSDMGVTHLRHVCMSLVLDIENAGECIVPLSKNRIAAILRTAVEHETTCCATCTHATAAPGPGLMETQRITPECRANRTIDGAWDEAVRRLREIYDAQVEHDPTITLGLSIGRIITPEEDR